MPYIPPDNRPPIDEKVQALAGEIADAVADAGQTAEISVHYRNAFLEIAAFLARAETGEKAPPPAGAAEELASTILEIAAGYDLKGGWTGELNYALTQLIQQVPYQLFRRGAWDEPLRYWIYAETVGALTRTAYDLHARMENDYVGNGLAGVFEDVKDEYKRRVNTAYEAAQILKSGDCYAHVPFRTELVAVRVAGVQGYQEVLLPKRDLER